MTDVTWLRWVWWRDKQEADEKISEGIPYAECECPPRGTEATDA